MDEGAKKGGKKGKLKYKLSELYFLIGLPSRPIVDLNMYNIKHQPAAHYTHSTGKYEDFDRTRCAKGVGL